MISNNSSLSVLVAIKPQTMFISYSLFIIIGLILIILLVLTFVPGRKSIPDKLFLEALRKENNGNFEAAVLTYENALGEAGKRRFNSNLKKKINEKLKLLYCRNEIRNA